MACSFASLSCPAHKPCIWVARGAGLATGKLHSTLRRSPALQARWLGAHGAAIARISSEGAVRVRDSKVQKNQRRKLKIEIGWPDALAIGAHPTQSIGFGPPNRIRLLLSMTRVGDAYHVPLKPVLEHIPNRKSALRRRRPSPAEQAATGEGSTVGQSATGLEQESPIPVHHYDGCRLRLQRDGVM